MKWSPLLHRSARMLSLALIMTVPASFAEEFGVADWGQDAVTIRDQERRPDLTPIGETDYLIYRANLPGVDETRLVYQFENGRLGTGRFIFTARPGSPTDTWLDQFNAVRSLITQQYGDPARQSTLYRPGIDQIPPSEWANALQNDNLILKTRWETDTSVLVQQLAWNGDRPHHQIIYRPARAADALTPAMPF